ncbi:hypothetical protein OUZ56_000121 [Daphnia magna]|uniref:Uncharacterized protein n=1 Tax=Daphnia magna TaxID=35525 RepID=A0ABQ9ZYS2_9CRUS|nr:hypothetical protein OUZ56_000121 [Daphnia magna]
MNVGFFVLFFCTTRRSGSTMEDPLVYGRNHVTPVSKADPGSTSRDNSKTISHDLLELLEKLQTSRLDDQRCVLPAYFTQHPPFFLVHVPFYFPHLFLW